jgi:Stretch-activated Ca2+-permeable channel component
MYEREISPALDSLQLDTTHFHLVSRQSNASLQLTDNAIVAMNIVPGAIDFWTFSPSSLNISGGASLYITVSTCTQPFPKAGLNATQVYASGAPPALQLYVSRDSSNSRPGPGSDFSKQNMTVFSQGFVNVTLTDISNDVFISVVSQDVSSDWQGDWSYQLGSSITGIYLDY